LNAALSDPADISFRRSARIFARMALLKSVSLSVAITLSVSGSYGTPFVFGQAVELRVCAVVQR
jgi:hypothetical protein